MANEKFRKDKKKFKNNVEKFFGEEHAENIDASGEQKRPFERILSISKIKEDIIENPLTDKEKQALQRGLNSNNKTGYKGVSYEKKLFKDGDVTGWYCANITFRGQTLKITRSKSPEDAASAWNNAVIDIFGDHIENLYLNKLPEHSQAGKWID